MPTVFVIDPLHKLIMNFFYKIRGNGVFIYNFRYKKIITFFLIFNFKDGLSITTKIDYLSIFKDFSCSMICYLWIFYCSRVISKSDTKIAELLI